MADEKRPSKFKAAANVAMCATRLGNTRTDPEYLRGIAEVKRLAGEYFKQRTIDEEQFTSLGSRMTDAREKSNVRKQTITDNRNHRQEQAKKARAEAEAEQRALEAAAEERRKTILNASAAGYDKKAAKSRRTKRCMKRSKFLVKPAVEKLCA